MWKNAFLIFISSISLVLPAGSQVIEERPAAESIVNQITRPPHHSLYIELAGPALFYSVNYEYRISSHIGLRAGLSWWSIDSLDLARAQIRNLRFVASPITVNYIAGKKAAHFEFGVGLMPVSLKGEFDTFYFIESDGSGKNSKLLGISSINFRYQKPGNGAIIRAGINPVFTSSDFYPAFGISFGYSFL